MSLNKIYDGTPLNATTANASPGSVATSTTGLWDSVTLGTQGVWIDVKGGVYSNSGTGGNFAGNAPGGADYTTSFAIRPSGEDTLNHGIGSYLPAGLGAQSNGIVVRYQRSTKNCYLADWDRAGGSYSIYTLVGGGATPIAAPAVAYNSAHTYSQYLQATGSNPTTLTLTVVDLTTSTTVLTYSITDSTASLQSAGAVGLDSWNGTSVSTRIQTYSDVVTGGLTVSPSTATVADGSTQSITATRTGGTGALVAALSGSGTLSTTAPTSGTAFTYTPPSTGSGTATVTVTDPTDSLGPATCSITYGPGASLVVSPASVVLGVVTPVTITGTNTSWTSATKPTVAGGTNAYLSNIAVSGQVITANFNPGSAAGTLTIGETADSATHSISATSSPSINVVWSGTSLTQGVGDTSPGGLGTTRIATVLAGLGPIATGSNTGVSGQTLVDMTAQLGSQINALYDSSKTYNILMVEGGHNDYWNGGYGGVSAATVESRITGYINAALAAHPGWLIVWSLEPPAANAAYPANFDALRDQSNAWLIANWRSLGLAALSTIAGDARIGLDGCEYNATYFNSGDITHMTSTGYAVWGEYDLGAIQSVLALGSLSSGSSGSSGGSSSSFSFFGV